MNLKEQDAFDKQFARRVSMMIESGLIWYEHYYHWADEIIMAMDEPPFWVIEIAVVKHRVKALAVVNEFVYSEPFESFNAESYTDEYVACLFLRYKSGEICWATFLNEAGDFTDGDNGHRYCEYFFYRLNDLEESMYSKELELGQRAEIEREYGRAITLMEGLYEGFLEHFRLYALNQ